MSRRRSTLRPIVSSLFVLLVPASLRAVCNVGPPLYCPDDPVMGGQMGVSLVATFDLASGAPAPPADPSATSSNGGTR